MLEIYLTYPIPEGSREIRLEDEKMSFGRGSDADLQLEDTGLSRLNSTIYREGDNVWIVDENSTNGTFVGGEKVLSSGTPLKDGDQIKIGNQTNLKVHIREKQAAQNLPVENQKTQTVSATNNSLKSPYLIPVVLTVFAFFVISVSAVFIGVKVFGGSGQTEYAQNSDDEFNDFETVAEKDKDEKPEKTPVPKSSEMNSSNDSTQNNADLTKSPEADQNTTAPNLPTGKKYQQMSNDEKSAYIEAKAKKVARVIGNRSSEEIPAAAVARIKSFVDGYASRANASRKTGDCRFGDNLEATYERAGKNAPFIIEAFNQQGIDPQIGLYLAMIESEHCICLQSPTGPLGMFQFTKATGETYGLNVRSGASPSNPDQRCEPEPAASAAAKYMKFLAGRYGTGPLSVPLAIGSYNSGEGGLSKNLQTALEAGESQERSFWTLIANAEKLAKQFQNENIKYVPKFFAAAIVGENPADFGMNLQPISTYSDKK